jgi:leader peptidase (prepilin peptidase)/N-methyltransferase
LAEDDQDAATGDQNELLDESAGKTTLPTISEQENDEPFNLSVPRSRCVECGHQIRVWENIPIISWLLLRGKCSSCRSPISWRYPWVEALTGLLTLTVLAIYGFSWFGLATCFFTWALIALTFIDYDTKLLPDQITLPLMWLGLFANGFFIGVVSLHDAVLGAIFGYLFLWSTYWGFKLVTGKEGMGYGDFKLLAALGAWLGWMTLPGIILIAAITDLVYSITRLALRRQSTAETIPFGPFLAIAGWVTLVFRDSVLGLFLA